VPVFERVKLINLCVMERRGRAGTALIASFFGELTLTYARGVWVIAGLVQIFTDAFQAFGGLLINVLQPLQPSLERTSMLDDFNYMGLTSSLRAKVGLPSHEQDRVHIPDLTISICPTNHRCEGGVARRSDTAKPTHWCGSLFG